jgi:hypothetical protein
MAAKPTTKLQAKRTANHQASHAKQAPCGPRPPAERAAHAATRQASQASNHQAGTAAHRPRRRHIQSPSKHGKRVPSRDHRQQVEMAANPANKKQAKQTASHQASNAEQALRGHLRPKADKAANPTTSKQCKAGRPPGGHHRPPTERAVNPSAKRQAWQATSRPGCTSRGSYRAAAVVAFLCVDPLINLNAQRLQSSLSAGATDHRLKWQQIQPLNKPSKLPATKQAT